MKIYRDGREIYELKDYKQIGRFMEVAIIEATIKDTLPIDIKVGDYVIFDYNNLKYTLYDVYPAKKQARSTTYQEAFVYDLKFKADTEQLAICPFLDLVPNDNGLVYSSLPSFSTFENVYGIAARLQANMDYLYPNQWQFRIVETDDTELRETLSDAREFAVGGESCLAGLKKIYDIWGVGFIHTFEDGLNVITIGKSAGKTSLFRYGKGMGLRTIKRSPQNNEQLCTRAYVFGGTRNIPARWYNNKGYIGEAQYAPNLMIPPSKWVDGIPQGAYIDAIFDGENRIEKYGLKIKTLNYDGSDSKKDEIYPSIEKMTAKNIRDAKAEIGENIYIPSTTLYPDEERMDMILEGSSIPDDGTPTDPGYVLYSDRQVQWTEEQSETITIAEMTGETKYKLLNVQRTINLCTFEIEKVAKYRFEEILDFVKFKKNDLESTISASLYLQTPSGEYIKIRDLAFTEELESGLQIPDSLHSLTEVGKYTLVLKFNVSWSFDWVVPQIGDEVYLRYTIQSAAVTLSRGEKALDNFFKIKIKQIGFNLNDYTASSGAYKNIHFRSGMCSGRSFNIAQCTYIEEEDAWELKCKRIVDSSLSQRFPNSIFNIAKDDRFVLLDINMPDLYVYAAMQRLYDTALRDLKYFSVPQYVIEPQIDNLQMARSPQILREGMYMPLDDLDISIINEEVLIDSVTIANKGTEIRTFEVTLRNDKVYNKYNKLADRLAELENTSQKTASNNAVSPVDDTKESEVMPPSSGITAKDVEIIVDPLTEDIETLKENDAEQDKKLLEFASMWQLDKQNNAVRTPLNLIVEGGGAFGKGSGGGGDTPTTSDVVIKFEGDDDVYAPVNGVITLPAYPEGGGGEGGGIDEAELEQYLKANQYAKKSDIPSLAGYATEAWVNQQGFLTQHQDLSAYAKSEDVANTYATKSALKGVSDSVSTLREDFDNLNDVLNGNVGGVIDTWNEVVSFLDGYKDSEDLATILSGMNTDIANRVLIEDFEKLEEAVNPLFGYFDANGNANNALKLGGHSADYFATADALNTHITAFNNYKTATNKRLNDLEALWYMDDEGNVHTTHNIIVEGGGAFGKGSGGGGDVPSGGGIDEAQLWNILGQSGTQTIHGSHIPDLSGKYLSVSGGTINGNLSIKRGGYPYISYSNADTFYGYLGFSGVGVPSMYDGTAWRDVIHSGNIGSYNAGSATKLQTARTIWGQNFDGAGNITKTLHITEPVPNTEYAEGIRINTMNGDFSSIWFNTINISGYDKGMWGITAMASGNFRIRGGANGLSDLVNITKDGNVLMGTTNDGGHKLRVQGSSYVTGEGIFGGVISANSGILSRNELSFRNNAVIQSYSLPLQINPQGNNVLIGTNADNGYKLAVNGSLNATTIHQNGTAIGSLAFKNSLVASDIPSLDWSKITSGKPTTLGGYGITDFVVKTTSSLNNATATAGIYRLGGTAPDNHGYGNAITLRHLSADTYGQLYISYNMGIPQGGVYWRGATTDSTAQSWRWMLDESNYSSYALPLSGGTIDGALKVNGNLSTDNVRFNREGVTQILAAYAGLNYDLSYYDGATWERVLTSKNYSSYALPLSGGTISSSGLAPLNIKRNSTGAAAIAYSGQSVTYGTLGFNDTTGPKWFDASYAEYTLIHSGNIGSQRVANADTLDDYDSTAFMRFNREEGTDLNSLSTNFPRIVEVVSATNTPTSNLWHQVMNWGSADAGYGIQVAHKYTDAATPLYFRNKVAGEWSDWKQLARITDNVASATKLQDNTAFTAWGQIFFNNGKPVSLSGKLTSVSYLRFYDANATSPGIYGGTHYSSSLTANDLAIYASGKIAIGGGNVLIGTTDDNGRKLQVNGKMSAHDYEGGSFSSNHADSFVENDKPIPWYGLSVYEGYTKGVFLTGYSFIHIHTTYCRFTLNSLGANLNHNLTVSGGGAFGSDIRYKDITSYQQLDLETIVNAPLFTFKWTDRDDKVEHLGTSAQYWLETQAKDAVNTANKDFYHLDYGALGVGIGISVAREVKGVKTEVQTLKEELSQVKKELKYYKELWQHSGHILHQHS